MATSTSTVRIEAEFDGKRACEAVSSGLTCSLDLIDYRIDLEGNLLLQKLEYMSFRTRHYRLNLRGERSPGLFPGAEAAFNMCDILQSHILGGLRGQRGAPAAGAKKHEALRFGEDRLGVGALRVDPELQHAAGAGERARHLAFALHFPRVAQIDEDDIGLADEGDRGLNRQSLDFGVCLGEELLVALFNLHAVVSRMAFG
jgi:hypothetical protein